MQIAWIEDLIRRAAENPERFTPKDEVGPTDTVVGTVPEELRPLRLATLQLLTDINEKVEKHMASHDDPDHTQEMCKQFHKEIDFIDLRARVLEALFMMSLEVKEQDGYVFEIRKDWQLVQVQEEREDDQDDRKPTAIGVIML